MSVRIAIACLLSLLATSATAAVFRDVQYLETTGVDPALQRLDVYTPEAPGPHGVLAILRGGDDKGALPLPVATLTARGYLVASIRTRPAASAGAVTDAMAAIDWVRAHASGYGGDRERMVLLGAGDGVVPAAIVVASAGAPPLGLRGVGLLDAAPLDAIATDAGSGPWRIPPVLLMRDHSTATSRRAGERWVDRVRNSGSVVQVLPREARDGGQQVDAVLAWLAALDVPRVQRFETLAFSAQPIAPADRVVALQASGHALFALTGGGARSRLMRRDAADGDWDVELELPDACSARCWLGEVPRSGDAPARLALVSAEGDPWRLFLRGATHGEWTMTSLGAGAGRGPLMAAARAGAGREVFVATAKRGVRIAIGPEGAAVAELSLPEGRITALAVVDGAVYAATAPARGLGPALWRLGDGAAQWQAVRGLPASEGAVTRIAAVPDPTGSGRNVLLLAAGARLLRVDPQERVEPALEIDLAATFADLWGSLGGDAAVAVSSPLVALRQPESGDLIHVAGLRVAHPDPSGGRAYYVARQTDGRYAYGTVDAGASPGGAVAAIAPSPFASDAGAAAWFGLRGAASPLLSGRLRWAHPARGLWWDRARSGHGLALEPTADGTMLLLYTYARDGSPTWFVARGELGPSRFDAGASGLVRPAPTRGDARAPDAGTRAGAVSLRFGVGAGAPECADADRRDALALAILEFDLDGQVQRWCIEPFVFAAAGAPDVALRGVWAPESDAEDWGLSLTSQGPEGAARLVAVAFHFDAAGEPRWALGAGPVRDGEAELALSSFTGACPGCARSTTATMAAGSVALRFRGWCGEVRGEVGLDLAWPGKGGGRLRRDAIPVVPRTLAACY